MTDDILTLDADGVQGYLDSTQNIIYVTYSRELTADSTRAYYRWMSAHVAPVIKDVRGIVVDFRKVTRIPSNNAFVVLQASQDMHRRLDTSHVVVALVVRDVLQEHLVRIANSMTGDQAKKKIVQSMDAALAFIAAQTEEPHT